MRDENVFLAISKSAFQIRNISISKKQSENTEMVNIEEELKHNIN